MPRPLNFVKSDIAGYKALGHIDYGGGYSGLGQTSTTVLDYPGLPNGHSMVATPLTPQQLDTLSAANAAYFGGSAMPVQTTTQNWVITNWPWLALGALFGLILLGGGRRG